MGIFVCIKWGRLPASLGNPSCRTRPLQKWHSIDAYSSSLSWSATQVERILIFTQQCLLNPIWFVGSSYIATKQHLMLQKAVSTQATHRMCRVVGNSATKNIHSTAMTLIHMAWESARCSKHHKTADLRMTELTRRTTKTRQTTDSARHYIGFPQRLVQY